MTEGYLHCFNWRGVPVRLHWSVLALGAFEVALGRSWVRLLGFAFIILMHELGHAVLVKRYGLRVTAIQIHPLGGECIHEPTRNQRQNVIIAWGGVLAQAVLIAAAFAAVFFWPEIRGRYVNEVLSVLTVSNAFMIAFNLIPIRPLDGHTAWQVKHLRKQPALKDVVKMKDVVSKKDVAPAKDSMRGSAKPSKAAVQPAEKTRLSLRQHDIDALVDDALEKARKATKDRERP
jgi:hypothetical protein